MSEENQTKQSDWSVKDLSEMERQNLLGFFALLIKVDKRVNPQLYQNANNRGSNNTNQAE
jgi:hypothetical protein